MSQIKIGARVTVPTKNVGVGTVAFIGETEFAKGEWIGIILDEKRGKNNGSIQGKAYFTCEHEYGMFVRSSLIQLIQSPPSRSGAATPAKSRLARKSLAKQSSTPRSRSSSQTRSKTASRETSPKREKSSEATNSTQPQEAITEETKIETEREETAAATVALKSSLDNTQVMRQLQADKEELARQVKDWQERTEALVVKRRADREALKDAERNRIQLQSLEEFKLRIMEQHAETKKELRDERKRREDLAEEFDMFREDMGEASETIEMLTLDKEMAEEQLDMLRNENDDLKVKLEEVETDLELLREEADTVDLDDESSGGDQSVLKMQIRMKDEENKKLKEALIKLRDLNTEEKTAAARAVKALKVAQDELDIKKKLTAKLEELNAKLEEESEELKEQVDLALGAEEMVEQLTTRILDLEDKIKEETERANDMEELHELDTEMAEAARETELELREDNDLAQMKVRELTKLLESERSHSADLQLTIRKFRQALEDARDQNQQLQEKSLDERGEGDGSEQAAEKAVDVTERILERRNHSAQVELDLRKLQIELLNNQVVMLNMFLPKAFHTRGGDSDGVNIELLLLRISNKARIVQTHAYERFRLDQPTGAPSQAEPQSWSAELCDLLEIMKCYVENFSEILFKCSTDTWKRIATLYHDLLPNESGLDYFIDLVRRDCLDETVSLINLNKSIGFISHVHGVHFAREDEDEGKFIFRFGRRGNSLSTRLATATARLQSLVLPGQELSDSAKLLTDIIARLPSLKQTFRRIQRHAPGLREGHMPLDERNQCRDAVQQVNIIADFLHYWSQTAHNLAIQLDQKYLPEKQLHDAAIQACNKVYGPGNEGFASVRNSITLSFPSIAQVNTRLQEGFYHTKNRPQTGEEVESACARRAAQQQAATPEELATHMEDRDMVIKEIKSALRVKSDEAEQQKLRAEMHESRAERIGLESEEKSRRQQAELEQVKSEVEKKDKEHEKTLDAYKNDIKSLKADKTTLTQQRQKLMNKSNVIERLGVNATQLGGKSMTPATSMVQDSPMLCDQIKSLSSSVNHLQRRLVKAEGRSLSKRVNALPPLPSLACGAVGDVDLIEVSRKIEHATAPILRPSKLIAVGQPQPALLRLAHVLDEKAKCIERLPVLEGELRNCHAAHRGDLRQTAIGGETTSKAFNQEWDGSGELVAEIWTKNSQTSTNVFLSADQHVNFARLIQI